MKDTIIRFFAQYYTYVTVILISAYFLFILGLPVALILSGLFSFISVLVAKLLKRIIVKKRNTKAQMFSTGDIYAFPSSHAAGLSSLIISTLGDPVWIFIAVSSAIILLARVKSKVHDYKDIIGGLLVGSVVTGVLIFGLILLFTL